MTSRIAGLAAAILLFGCAHEAPTSPDLEPSYARGGEGGGGGAPAGIAPTQLGDLKALGCRGTMAAAINDAPQTVVGGNCSRAGTFSPFIWSSSGTVIIPDTGRVLDVSANGSTVGELDFRPFYRAPGSAPTPLPLSAGMPWGSARAIDAAGTLVVGSMDNGTSQPGAIWRFANGTWTAEGFSGYPNDVSDDGSLIVGASSGHAAVWSSSGTTMTALPDDGAHSSSALAVNQTGTVVVGVIYVPHTSDPSVLVDKHVAWINDGTGNWALQILPGLNILEGEALGVATQQDGSVIAVGESWEKTPSYGQLWAVAWRKPSGSLAFGAPIKLNPISKNQTAGATDINSKGEIVGYSYTKVTTVAVMWKLQ